MEIERRKVTVFDSSGNPIVGSINLFEETPENEDMVRIELTIGERKWISEKEDFFSALVSLRMELEQEKLLLACNGAAKNVYPSPMQQAMGYGRMAYKLFLGQQARNMNVVDIFDYDRDLEIATIKDQSDFYALWRKSILG